MTTEATAGFRRPFAGLGFTVRTGILLLVVFSVVRVVLVLQANVTGQYNLVSIVFVAMIALPWILLTREGRRRSGITRPTRWWVLPLGLIAGGATCLAVFSLSTAPFEYIGGTYSAVPDDVTTDDRLVYFIIFAVIGMTFSPLGEEFLYRGIAQESFASRLGQTRAAFLDAAAFALVHLAHFGIVYVAGTWQFLPGPAALWFASMFVASLVFHAFRRLSGSVFGAVATHAGFNIAMTALIFYGLDTF